MLIRYLIRYYAESAVDCAIRLTLLDAAITMPRLVARRYDADTRHADTGRHVYATAFDTQ